MADHITTVRITHTDDQVPKVSVFKNNQRRGFNELSNWVEAFAGGRLRGSITLSRDNGDAVAASGTVTLSSASGTVGASINGVSITVSASGGDTATAAALASAINASSNALVAPYVSATSALGVVTITAKTPGAAGNVITLAASGTGALASGARLTGGTDATTAAVFTLTR